MFEKRLPRNLNPAPAACLVKDFTTGIMWPLGDNMASEIEDAI
jgi:hypothetical protein